MCNINTINYLIAILLMEGKLNFLSLQIGTEGLIGVWLISKEEAGEGDDIKLPKKDLENIIDTLGGYLETGHKK